MNLCRRMTIVIWRYRWWPSHCTKMLHVWWRYMGDSTITSYDNDYVCASGWWRGMQVRSLERNVIVETLLLWLPTYLVYPDWIPLFSTLFYGEFSFSVFFLYIFFCTVHSRTLCIYSSLIYYEINWTLRFVTRISSPPHPLCSSFTTSTFAMLVSVGLAECDVIIFIREKNEEAPAGRHRANRSNNTFTKSTKTFG